MRKIQTQVDIDRKRKRNNVILGVLMILLLVVAPIGYSLITSDKDGGSDVNELGVDFVRSGGTWKATIGEGVFGFQNLPSEVSDVDVNVSASLGEYSGDVLYFVNPGAGVSEVLNNFRNYILRYQEACLGNESVCEGDLPIKSCYDNVIIFEEGNDSKVYQDNNCIYIVGDSVKATDAFLYKVLGVY